MHAKQAFYSRGTPPALTAGFDASTLQLNRTAPALFSLTILSQGLSSLLRLTLYTRLAWNQRSCCLNFLQQLGDTPWATGARYTSSPSRAHADLPRYTQVCTGPRAHRSSLSRAWCYFFFLGGGVIILELWICISLPQNLCSHQVTGSK